MEMIEKRVKDKDILELCEIIIFEYPFDGLPIGNYTSQYFANFYLSSIDHYMKEAFHCKYYLRYMDDIIIVGWSKPWLRRALKKITQLLSEIGLEVKPNWCIRPVTEGIDWCGYVTYPDHIMLRKRTKMRLKKKCKDIETHNVITISDYGSLNSYAGSLKWCDGHHLASTTVNPLIQRYLEQQDMEYFDYVSQYGVVI